MNRNVRILFLVLLLYAVCVLPLAIPRQDIVAGNAEMTPHWDERCFYYFDDIVLNRGIYTLRLTCEAEEDLAFQITGDGKILVNCDLSDIPAGQTQQEARFYVKHDKTRIDIELFSKEENERFLPVELEMRFIYRPRTSVSCYTVYFLFAVCATAVIWLFYRRSREGDSFDSALCLYALILLTVFLCAPYLRRYIPQGDDTPFHLSRIVHIAEEISSFRIPPRISAEAYAGYGYPLSIFYGGLFLVLPALLYLLGVPLWLCYNAFVCMIYLAAVSISYYTFRTITRSRWYGLFFTSLYAGSYRLIHNQLSRGAIGEGAAMAFIPLVFLGVFMLLQKEGEQQRKGVLFLVAGFTGLIQSHVLSTTQVSLFLFLFCLAKIKLLIREKIIWRLLQAALWTAVINLWFLVPFLDYYLRHDIKGKDEAWQISGTGASTASLLLGGGNAIILFLVIGLFLTAHIRTKEKQNNAILLLGLSLFALFLASDWMPWLFLEETLPVLHKILGGYLQFATRYLSISTALICVLGAYILSPEVSPLPGLTGRPRNILYGILLAVLIFSLSQGFTTIRNQGLTVPQDNRISVSDGRFYSWDEHVGDALYLLTDINWVEWVATDHSKDVLPGSPAVTISGVQRDGMQFHLHVENISDRESFIVFPVWNYYGYVAESGKELLEITDGEGHLVCVTIPGRFNGDVTMGFREPWYWRVAEITSLVGLLLFLFLYRRNRTQTCHAPISTFFPSNAKP